MQILVVGRAIPSKENNMLGCFEYEQAQMLARYGHEVYYLSVDLRSIRHKRKIGFVKENRSGVTVDILNIPIGRTLPACIRNRLYGVFRKYQLRTFSNRYGVPDIVNVHYPSIYPYDIFIPLQNQGTKIVGTEHWSKVQNQDLSKTNLDFLKDFINKADAITCVGDSLKKSIVQLTETKREIFVIPNIVSPVFSYKNEKASKKSFRFLAVGRLSKEKGYDKLIQSFCNVFGNDDTVHLHIVGRGDEFDRLQELVANNNAESIVTLHGLMQREELADFYHQCDVLVMSSDYETFGVPAAEAMACGLPVIVPMNTGIARYVTDKSGIVIENNSIENISTAMKSMYMTYDNYSKKNISEYANEHFSESVVYKMIREEFETAVRGEIL